MHKVSPKENNIRSITVVRMEVPCCAGMTYVVKEAINEAGVEVPMKETVVRVKGTI